jgi:hypothetical protein
VTVDPNAGMSEADLARAAASDANLAGIIAGRRDAAAKLLAPPEPAATVRANWEPVRQAIRERQSTSGGEPGVPSE